MESLPVPIVLQVFSLLDGKSIFRLSLTCKYLRDFILKNDEIIFRKRYFDKLYQVDMLKEFGESRSVEAYNKNDEGVSCILLLR